MTNPKHTSSDLVKRLIDTREYHCMMYSQYDTVTEAADRIEALEAENERLRERVKQLSEGWDAMGVKGQAIIDRLQAENERLREALEPFTFREDGDDEAISIQHPSIIVRCEVTYGDIQLARAALEARHD